ncbi:MAG TPA: rhamnulokinase family protein [Nakamurella sp.]
MSSSEITLAAVDLGASSGRVMLGRVGPDRLELTQVNRFRNGAVRLPDGLYWDILGLYQDILEGLRDAHRKAPEVAGLAIDTWAVDYGLLDTRGALVGNPRNYRDPRTDPVIEQVQRRVSAAGLYQANGLQHLPFNTLYQFAAEPDLTERRALLIPDLLGYWLTGHQVAEQTNASTTGLLSAVSGDWDTDLIEALGLPAGLLPPVVAPGATVGELSAAVRADTGIDHPLTVTTVGSHDTASAVVGVPAQNPNFAYISCGTWGLVGVELDAPVLTEAGRAANFTNERGVDGTIRYLRNVMGLWILSETLRTWRLHGPTGTLPDLLDKAAQVPAGGPTFDPDAPEFLAPGDMPVRIAAACRAGGQRVPQTRADVVRCILDSLAIAFAARIEDAQRLSGRAVEVVHVVGGGTQNALLCQLIADACGRPVVAGPVEATALGNILVQARTHGVLHGDLWALRRQLRAAISPVTYRPRVAAAR